MRISKGSGGKNPGQGSGKIQNVGGKNTPTVVKTGTTTNKTGSRSAGKK